LNQIEVISKNDLEKKLIDPHPLTVFENQHWDNTIALGYKIMRME
jgi:hypothetical protein